MSFATVKYNKKGLSLGTVASFGTSRSSMLGSTTPALIRAGEILGLLPNRDWEILDQEGPLALVHFRDEADLSKYGQLRGTVVDTDRKLTVCRSFGFSPTAVLKSLVPRNDGALVLKDIFDNTHFFPSGEYHIRMGFEGVILRCFKHLGKVYRSTCRRLNPARSRWGNSPLFLDMYNQLQGPSDDDLFSSTAHSSPWCYTIMIVHPDVQVATKRDVGTGYIVLLNVERMWSEEEGRRAFTPSELGTYEAQPKMNFEVQRQLPVTITKPLIFQSPNLTLAEANYHLRFGFYSEREYRDARLETGEFIIIFNTQNPHINLKVFSPSYNYRSSIQNDDAGKSDNSNLKFNFYSFLQLSSIPVNKAEDLNRFAEQFPLILPNEEVILPLIYGEEPNKTTDMLTVLSTRASREYFIWYSFFLCIPPGRQRKAALLLEEMRKDRQELIPWIYNLMTAETKPDREFAPEYLFYIMRRARNKAQREQKSNTSYEELLKGILRGLVLETNGKDLYRMITYMKKQDRIESTA